MSTRRSLAHVVVAGVALFVVLVTVAMVLYPGGTCWDTTTHGHRFWQNFLCDLEWNVARDGEPNPVGSRFAEAAMAVLAVSMAPHWLLSSEAVSPRPGLARWVRRLGLTSVVGSLLVNVVPSNRFGVILHAATVVAAGIPGLGATTLAVWGLFASEERPRVAALLGAALLAIATADFVLYIGALVHGGPGSMLIPAAQKMALLLLLLWMLRIAVTARRRSAPRSSV